MEPVREWAGQAGRHWEASGTGPKWTGPPGSDPPPLLCSRWFSIQNSQLVYQKKLKVCGTDPPTLAGGQAGERGVRCGPPQAEHTRLQDVLTVVVDDLRLCSVKPCEDIERRFCFEVVSPTK